MGVDAEVAVEGVGGMPQHLTVFCPGLPFGCGDQDAWAGDLFRLVRMQHRNAVELPAQGHGLLTCHQRHIGPRRWRDSQNS